MVMKQNAMRRNLRQSIIKSFGRYIAIAMIIALGAALFVGLLMTKTDMIATGQQFVDEQNMFDLRMISNYGWSEKFVDKFIQLEGVESAEGSFFMDLIARIGAQEDGSVYRFYSVPETVNKLALRSGRMPEKSNECLADGYFNDESLIGQKVYIALGNDEDSLEEIRHRTFTVVGLVSTPLYMDMNRGTTSVGNGALENYFFVPQDAFDVDYYTEIDLTIPGDYPIYSEEYQDVIDEILDTLEPEAEELCRQRFQDVKDEAEEEYADGYQEYLDGVKEYEDGKAEAEQELADALKELEDAEKELEDNRRKLIQAGEDIEAGQEQVNSTTAELKAQLKTVESNLEQVKAAIPQAEGYVKQFGDISVVKDGISAAKEMVSQLKKSIKAAQEADPNADVSVLQAQLAAAQGELDKANGIYEQYKMASGTLAELKANKKQLQSAKSQILDGIDQLIAAGVELAEAEETLMINWGLWREGKEELADGWVEYEDAKIEVAEELAEAEEELRDAEQELADARQEIDDMEEADLIILERSSNVGYNNLDSSSDIVSGVSRVLPVFFLLVAALVCITTMTRMIDEERTQIGTLKALGYSNREIMSKYLIYSGSGALIGCSLGIALGCTIIPQIIWEAYKIMLYIQPGIVLTVEWPLALAVVFVYTAVMLFVTWYCCRRTLKEEPAELIRPKAPEAGKKILLEYLPFWNSISFLNKVTIRNIFRYRQRMAMMLVGIGGCTALLVTGFGLRDSLVNVVDFQYQDITKYDLEVYFKDQPSKETLEEFESILGPEPEFQFFHQSSVELEVNKRVKEIYMIAGDQDIRSYVDTHAKGQPIPMPEKGQVVISIGVAEMLELEEGDSVILRNSDMQEMNLTVSGIYENHVYNYSIVSSDSIAEQWGEPAEMQMAFIQLPDNMDPHEISAKLTDMDEVLNVSVSRDLANMVRSMMKALDLVIILIVFCAGLLAVIVLYNLTNININERIREIATIKVLGFRAGETGAYVFKENLSLTVAGSVFGLFLGKLLLDFVMSQIKIDMVWFKTMISRESYIIAIVLTLLSALVVDFVFYFKLQKINMAEALKSVE